MTRYKNEKLEMRLDNPKMSVPIAGLTAGNKQ